MDHVVKTDRRRAAARPLRRCDVGSITTASGVTDLHMNHVNLCVADVPRSRAFFERYFGFRLLVEKGADTFVGLVDDGGMILAISNFNHAKTVQYPPLFHVGFFLDSDDEVNAVHDRLAADGLEPGEVKHFHGAWTFYVKAPGGGTVEVAHQGPGFD